jgi:hypothetical protein
MNWKLKSAHFRLPRSIALLVLATGAARVEGQFYYDFLQPEEPPLTMPQVKYLKMDVEAEQINYRSQQGAGSSKSQRLYLAPGVGIGWNYFLYHPDLLTYSLLFEPGYVWQESGAPGQMSQTDMLVLNGNFTATLLQLKPYATTFTYSRSHDDVHYDFFNSATVDTERWGAISGYREGPVPVVVTFDHSQTDSSGLNFDSTSKQTTVSLQAQNSRRKEDLTELNYQFTQYDSVSSDAVQSFGDSSTAHHLSVNDTEHFNTSSLASSLFYDHIEGSDETPSDSVNLSLDYSWQHTPRLRSFYGYSFSDYSTDGADSMNNSARAGLQHQLYDNLTSMVDVTGAKASSDSFGSQLDLYSVGTDASVDYSKRLGDWGHLSLGDSASYSLTHQDSSGGELLVPNESHAVPLNYIFFLTQPRAVTFVSLTETTGAITYVRGSDYDVITTTDPWQIQIYSTGPNHLAQNQTVKANYIVQPNPTGSYSTFNNGTEIRLDFWQQRAGIYARYNFSENRSDSPGFVFDNIREFQAGTDLNWHRLRLAANYTDHKSSLNDYQSIALSEGYTLLASAKNSASVDFHQQWSTYPGQGTNSPTQNARYYSFTGRYTWHPVSAFSWDNQVGYEIQHGAGLDQDLITANSYLSWFIGKLDFRLGYEFENQKYPTETRDRNFVFLRMRRNF